MKIARYQTPNAVRIGRLEGERVRDLGPDLFAHMQVFGQIYDLAQVRLLAPLAPRKIVGVGGNYREHALEMGHEPPASRRFIRATWSKWSSKASAACATRSSHEQVRRRSRSPAGRDVVRRGEPMCSPL